MGGKLDQIRGRIKDAAGLLADDDGLKRGGKLDQVVGKVKDTLTRQQTQRPSQVMRIGRQREGRKDGIAQPAILAISSCLCDLQETVIRRRNGAAANLKRTPSLPTLPPREIDIAATGSGPDALRGQ